MTSGEHPPASIFRRPPFTGDRHYPRNIDRDATTPFDSYERLAEEFFTAVDAVCALGRRSRASEKQRVRELDTMDGMRKDEPRPMDAARYPANPVHCAEIDACA